jgi:hypothetical protein
MESLRLSTEQMPRRFAPEVSSHLEQHKFNQKNLTQKGNSMEAIGLLVTLEARPGKEADAEYF